MVKGEPLRYIQGHQNSLRVGRLVKPLRYIPEDRGYKTPCWIWQLVTTRTGYAQVWDRTRRRMIGAHIVAYEQAHGSVPAGLELDHLCKVRNCVNPAHLEAVTHTENVRRGDRRLNNWNARKTHCPKGHPYTPENTYHSKGSRKCRTCVLERQRSS